MSSTIASYALSLRQPQALVAVERDVDREALGLEAAPDRARQPLLVLDDSTRTRSPCHTHPERGLKIGEPPDVQRCFSR